MIKKGKKVIAFVVMIFPFIASAIPEVWIRQNDVPFVIGQWAIYDENIEMFEWTPFDSMRTWWDLTALPGGRIARVHLLNPSQGIAPAPDTFPSAQIVELDTMGDNSVVWSYLSETQLYFYVQGIDFETGGFRFIGNYQPDYKCYAYPIYDGAGWISAWTWTYYLDGWLPYTANEQHQKVVVAKGKVKVPFSGNHFWPCLVIRDYMEFTDNFGTIDRRWIYEWVVPGRFGGGNGVAAALSTNGASQNFVIVDRFLQLHELYVPSWDVYGPEFSNTTIWPDTTFSGPYVIQTTITDSTGIGADSLFYNVNGGQFYGLSHDSVDGNTYYYTIPEVAEGCTLGYFLWAEDSFSVANGVDLWHTDPICAPESTYYKFAVTMNVNEMGNGSLVDGYMLLTAYPNPFGNSVNIMLQTSSESRTANPKFGVSLQIYDAAGRLVKNLMPVTYSISHTMCLSWDGTDDSGCRLVPGIYFVNLKTADRSSLLIQKVIKLQ